MAAEQLIEHGQQYYIVATERPAAVGTHVLKHGETFAVFDDFGDIEGGGGTELGLYHAGTRFLSRLKLTLAAHRPLLLSSTVRRDNVVMSVDLTNPDLYTFGEVALPRGTLHINRTRYILNGVCYELIRIRNFALAGIAIDLAVSFGSDYVDIFEVRGQQRKARGALLPVRVHGDRVVLTYWGLDDVTRRTTVSCSPPPDHLDSGRMQYRLELGSRAERTIALAVACEIGTEHASVLSFDDGLGRPRDNHRAVMTLADRVESSNPQFNAWLRCSAADLGMMLTPTEHGLYPFAGVPWFDTTFGRDGIVTALQTLWLWPDLSRGVLTFLASTQARETSPEHDAQPGKILHEARKGEMATLGEIPFGRYYGSVDATPLFVVLAGAYFRRTSDLGYIESIWENIRAALDWIDRYGDLDRDGFVEYARRSATGLIHQGWKDSHDSVFHADGQLAEGPIALCEVQGYVYAARLAGAHVADAIGQTQLARELRQAAEELRTRFEERFWCEDTGSYALALDGDKRRCAVRTSNPGHCLYTGLVEESRARAVLDGFAGEHFYSGWGLRTVAENELRFNPMAYHNGSVWPHDNAFAAAGAARYQRKTFATRILTSQFDASTYFELHRLPELFCGFRRREGEAPTRYPVACSPQAWAAGAVFMLLEACLGISIDAQRRIVSLTHPLLPEAIDMVRIHGIDVGDAAVDLTLHRYSGSVGVDVERRVGRVDVVVNN
jgi:glycogen debranching enzyme